MTQNTSMCNCADTLATLPFEQGFHFCIDGGKYIGVTATSIHEFTEKIKMVDQNSVNFHFEREDFQKWIRETFCDKELANRIEKLKEKRVADEKLRQELVNTIDSYINNLSENIRGKEK